LGIEDVGNTRNPWFHRGPNVYSSFAARSPPTSLSNSLTRPAGGPHAHRTWTRNVQDCRNRLSAAKRNDCSFCLARLARFARHRPPLRNRRRRHQSNRATTPFHAIQKISKYRPDKIKRSRGTSRSRTGPHVAQLHTHPHTSRRCFIQYLLEICRILPWPPWIE
jgi:hypothetical protein